METSVDLIVDYLLGTEKRVVVISRDTSPSSIHMSLAERVIGVNLRDPNLSVFEKLDLIKSNEEKLNKRLVFPNGVSRFYMYQTFGKTVRETVDACMLTVLEQSIDVILIENEFLLTKSMNLEEFRFWEGFKNLMKFSYAVEIKQIIGN